MLCVIQQSWREQCCTKQEQQKWFMIKMTHWYVLENKGLYLVKDIELSLVCTFAVSVSCHTPVSMGFGRACKISIEGYCVYARNAQTLRGVLSVSKNRSVSLSLWKLVTCCLRCVMSPLHMYSLRENNREIFQ